MYQMAFLRELWYRQTWETGVFFHLCFIRREGKKEKGIGRRDRSRRKREEKTKEKREQTET